MRITQAFTFEAAHWLPNVSDGHRCKRMHGHSYRVEFTFEGTVDPATGFVVDFFDIEGAVKPIIQTLDHSLLNETIPNPTAENIALWLQRAVGEKFLPRNKTLTNVRVYETPMCWADRGNAWPEDFLT